MCLQFYTEKMFRLHETISRITFNMTAKTQWRNTRMCHRGNILSLSRFSLPYPAEFYRTDESCFKNRRKNIARQFGFLFDRDQHARSFFFLLHLKSIPKEKRYVVLFTHRARRKSQIDTRHPGRTCCWLLDVKSPTGFSHATGAQGWVRKCWVIRSEGGRKRRS